MSGKTCGEFGGINGGGKPCGNPAGSGTDHLGHGRCEHHPDDSPFHDIPHPKKRAFLAAFAETGSVTKAAEAAAIDRTTPYSDPWKEDEQFQRAWDRARPMACEMLEAEAVRRAVEGVEEPVGFYKGSPSATVRRYSDTLLIFLLKGANPEKYRERTSVEVSGQLDTGVMRVPEPDRDWTESAQEHQHRLAALARGNGGKGAGNGSGG